MRSSRPSPTRLMASPPTARPGSRKARAMPATENPTPTTCRLASRSPMILPRSALQIGIVASMTAPRDASVYCSPMLKVSGNNTNSTSPSSPNRSSRSHRVRRYLGAATSRIAASSSPPCPNRRTARLTGGTSRTATLTATTDAPNSTAAMAALALARRSADGLAFGGATETPRQIPIHRSQQIDCLNGSSTRRWRPAEHRSTAGADSNAHPARNEPEPAPHPDHRLDRRAVTPDQLRPIGPRDLGRPGLRPLLRRHGTPAVPGIRGSQRRQRRHVGRGLRRRPRTGQRPHVDRDDPDHQEHPHQRQPHKGRPTPLPRGRLGPLAEGRLSQLPSDQGDRRTHRSAGVGEGPGSRAATAVALMRTGRTPNGRPTGSSRPGPGAARRPSPRRSRRGRVAGPRGRPPRPWCRRRRSRPPWPPPEPHLGRAPGRAPTRGGRPWPGSRPPTAESPPQAPP